MFRLVFLCALLVFPVSVFAESFFHKSGAIIGGEIEKEADAEISVVLADGKKTVIPGKVLAEAGGWYIIYPSYTETYSAGASKATIKDAHELQVSLSVRLQMWMS